MDNSCVSCPVATQNEEFRLRVAQLEALTRDAEAETTILRRSTNRERSIGGELWRSAVTGIKEQIAAIARDPDTPPKTREQLLEIIGTEASR